MKMQKQTLPPLPVPKKERILRQAKIDAALWNAVDHERKKKGLKIQDVFEWALKAFLAQCGTKAKD